MDSPLLISNFPVSNIALIYFTLASRGVNKKVKARNGQQSKSEAWVEVLFCCLVPGHMLNFFLNTPPVVCTTSARRHQRQVLFVLFILIALIQLGQTTLMWYFLHTVWMWEGGGDIFDSLWIFLLNASANPVTQLDGSITHECLTRIWDFGFHRFENKKWSIQRGWKWQEIFRFSFLVLERALKEYRFPRKAV